MSWSLSSSLRRLPASGENAGGSSNSLTCSSPRQTGHSVLGRRACYIRCLVQPNEGATWTSYVPIANPVKKAFGRTRCCQPIEEDSSDAIGLLVDDEDSSRRVFAQCLSLSELRTLPFDDLAEVLALLNHETAKIGWKSIGRQQPLVEEKIEQGESARLFPPAQFFFLFPASLLRLNFLSDLREFLNQLGAGRFDESESCRLPGCSSLETTHQAAMTRYARERSLSSDPSSTARKPRK